MTASLAAVEIGPQTDRIAAEALNRLPAGDVAHALEELAASAVGSVRTAKALSALCRFLSFAPESELPSARLEALRTAASENGLPRAQALLAAPRERPEADFEVPYDPEISQLSLGHQKSLARRADPDRMARLAAQGDARVVRELLLNPRLTEQLVVRIAARRPIRGEVLMEICRSAKWGVRTQVRLAVAMNPYAPPGLALRLLPQLSAADLRKIAASAQMAGEVRAAARILADRRSEPSDLRVQEVVWTIEALGADDAAEVENLLSGGGLDRRKPLSPDEA